MPKTNLSWSEPFFFLLRLRTLQGWLVRLAIVVGIAAIVFVILQLFGRARPLETDLEISLIIAGLLTLLPDVALLQRDVTITDHAIEWETPKVQLSFSGKLPHANTADIELFRPGEWRFKCGGMQVNLNDGRYFLFAIPRSKRLETIATVLTRLGIPVTLSGWDPTTADTRVRVDEELSAADLPASTRDAAFAPLPPGEPKLVPTSGAVFAALAGAGPALIALLGMIGAGIYLWWDWSDLETTEKWLIGAGGVAALVLGFAHLVLIGQYVEKSFLINMGRKSLRTRLDPLVDADDEAVFAVSLYSRESWTKVISKEADFGFLQFNRRKRALVFEGNKERWVIPATALTVLRVEEAGVGKEGSAPTEIRYFVVIGTFRDDEEWEIGMVLARTKWGFDNAASRRARMGELFEELRTAITQGVPRA
jgi:hypothetical protein